MLKTLVLAELLLSACAFAADLPSEVEKAIAERKASIAEADKAYLTKLERLHKGFVDSGNTKDADLVAKLITQAGGSIAASAAVDATGEAALASLVGTWKRDWDNSIFVFKDTKGGLFGGKTTFTMTYDIGKKRVVVVAGKWVDELEVTPGSDEVKGKATDGKKYKLSRVK